MVISLSAENSRFYPVKGVLHEKMDSSGSRPLVPVGIHWWKFFIRCNCSFPTATATRRSQCSRSRGAQRILRGGTLVSQDWHRRRRWSDQSPVYNTDHHSIADLAADTEHLAS